MKFNFLNKLFGSTNDRKINALLPIVEKINLIDDFPVFSNKYNKKFGVVKKVTLVEQ